MTKDEALRMALEALETSTDWDVSATGRQLKSMQAITALRTALAQTQEPMAWFSTGLARMFHWTSDKPAYGDDWVPLYTTPPQREFVGLTKEEIAEFDTWHDNREEEVGWCNPSEIVAYIEAKLKQKNGIKE